MTLSFKLVFLTVGLFACLDLDAQSKLGVYAPQSGNFLLDASGNFAYGSGDYTYGPLDNDKGTPVVGDWNGDGRQKIGLYINGFWLLDMNGNGVWDGPNVDRFIALGGSGQIPVVGDWNGDGTTKVGVYNAGFWALDYNGNGVWDGPSGGDEFIACGGNPGGEQPVIGDWNGDGRSKVGYFYAPNGSWALEYNGNGVWDSGDMLYYFGSDPSTKGVVGVWNHDNASSATYIGIYTAGYWLIDYNGNGIWDGTSVDRFTGLGGNANEYPVVGDWNGSSTDKIGVFFNGTTWALDSNGNFAWDNGDTLATFSDQEDTLGQPVVGKWTTGGVIDPFATPDPQPVYYANYLTNPGTLNAACNITGNWTDSVFAGSVSSAVWSLTQQGNAIGGSLTVTNGSCGSKTFSVTGTFSNNVGHLSTSNPQPDPDACGVPGGSVTADFTLSSCSLGATTDTVSRQGYTYNFQNYPPQTLTGNGTLSLTGTPTSFTTSPSPFLYLSTGDSNVAITTISSNSSYAMSNVVYTSQLYGYPNSDCYPNLSISVGSGTGSAPSTISASPAGCGGIFNVYANVGGTTSQNIVKVVVPPQILLQVLYGEAHSQPDDITQQAVGLSIRNRFGDNVFFRTSTTYQNAIYAQQFNGVVTGAVLTNGRDAQGNPIPELRNAAAVFGGSSTVSVANAKCFISPTASEWQNLLTALNTGTTVLPRLTHNTRCFKDHAQYIYKSSVSPSYLGNGVPSFVFVQWRNLTDPAVIQIP